MHTLKHNVATYRSAGLEAKWGKIQGTPFIFLRSPSSKLKHQRETWWAVTDGMFKRAQQVGVLQAFDEHTLLGDIFSI